MSFACCLSVPFDLCLDSVFIVICFGVGACLLPFFGYRRNLSEIKCTYTPYLYMGAQPVPFV